MVCGDGIVASPFERCDADNLDNVTCLSLGYYGGELACSGDCLSFDESDCMAAGRCGDEIVQTTYGEDCDGSNLNEQTCASMVPTLPYGLLTCGDDCHFVTTGCRADLITLIDVPAGTFQRDATVTNLSVVSAFRMSNTEITRWQFPESTVSRNT